VAVKKCTGESHTCVDGVVEHEREGNPTKIGNQKCSRDAADSVKHSDGDEDGDPQHRNHDEPQPRPLETKKCRCPDHVEYKLHTECDQRRLDLPPLDPLTPNHKHGHTQQCKSPRGQVVRNTPCFVITEIFDFRTTPWHPPRFFCEGLLKSPVFA